MADNVETKSAKPASVETKYTMEEFYENPGVLGTTQDIVMAAFTYNGVKTATVKEAKKLVNDFKGKKVGH